jgi:hypothetical protein
MFGRYAAGKQLLRRDYHKAGNPVSGSVTDRASKGMPRPSAFVEKIRRIETKSARPL